MFMLQYGWRLWRGLRLQWSLLTLGLACFSALLLLLLQLGPQLRSPQPAWAKPNAPVATVHRTDPQGRYKPVSNAELYRLTQLPSVEALAIARFGSSELRLADRYIDRTAVVYYSENLPDLLGLGAPFPMRQAGQQQQVFISDWLWQVLGKPAVAGLELQVRISNKRYAVAGVLPAALNRFGGKRPGVWLPWEDRFLPVLDKDEGHDLNKGPGPVALALTENLPDSVGFIALNGSVDLAQLAQQYDQLAVEWVGLQDYKMLEARHHAEIISGIELFPEQRTDLMQQFWLLFCLTLLCGAVVAINLLFCLVGQLVQRQHEIGMRQMLGARPNQLSLQLAVEQLPLWCAAVTAGALLYWQGTEVLAGLNVYQQYFGSAGLPFHWGYAGVALGILSLFLLLCSQLPLLWFLRSPIMFRNRQGQRNKLQHYLSNVQLLSQISFAGLALLIALSLQIQLAQQQNSIARWQQLEELELRFNPGVKPDAALQRGELGVYTPEQVAFSSSFTMPNERQLSTTVAGKTLEVFVGNMEVSSHYLQLIGAELLAGSPETDSDGLIINQALADLLLEPGQSYFDLPGTPLTYLTPMPVQAQIRGVVANLPHRGVAAAAQPMLYTQLKPSPWYAHTRLQVTLAPALVDAFSDEVEEWAYQQGQDLEIRYPGTLATQLEQLNEPYWVFARISLWLAGLISLLAGLSLYYQLKVQLVTDQSMLATKLAVGASAVRLTVQLCGQQLLLLLCSIPVCALLLLVVQPWLSAKLTAPVFHLIAVLPAFGVLLLLVLLATVLPALRLLRQPIALLLQGRAT
jgi:hypothetical protein